MDPKELKKILNSEAGKPIKDFLLVHYLRLKSIDNIKDCDTIEEQALEIKAAKKAAEILKDILSQIVAIEDTEENTVAEEDKLFSL